MTTDENLNTYSQATRTCSSEASIPTDFFDGQCVVCGQLGQAHHPEVVVEVDSAGAP